MAGTSTSSYQTSADPRNGVFIQGVSPAPYAAFWIAATSYVVKDFYGNVVSSATLPVPPFNDTSTFTTINVTLATPVGGWKCGWYMVHHFGPDQGGSVGTTYGGGTFYVVPNDSRFIPPPAGNVVKRGGSGEAPDVIGKAVFGAGTSRVIVGYADHPEMNTEGFLSQALLQAQDCVQYWTSPGSQYLDAARPRALWCLFPNQTWDQLDLPGASGGAFGSVFVATGSVDATKTYVAIAPGTSSGAKLTVYSGTRTTLVETYDNLASSAAAATAINGVSSRIYFVPGQGTAGSTQAAFAIGRMRLRAQANNNWFGDVFCLDGTLSATTFVAIGPGTSSGTKIRVFSPNSSTLVETYDNLVDNRAAETAINGVSTRIYLYSTLYNQVSTPGTFGATSVSSTFYNGTVFAVNQLYAAGVTRFEGPQNEPDLGDTAGLPQKLKIFIDAVHAGNASAKAIGPCAVHFDSTKLAPFMAACNARGIKPDGFTTHSYDWPEKLPQDRVIIQNFVAALIAAGWDNLERWETENNPGGVNVATLAVMTRFALTAMYLTLLYEEAGIRKEYAPIWYDCQHGFLGTPSWWEEENTRVAYPTVAMLRTLTAECWGALYDSRLVFPSTWDYILSGWRYNAAGGDRLVLFSWWMPNVNIIISTDATGSLTVVDPWGNTSSVSIIGGRASIDVNSVAYVRIPHGATATIYNVNGWTNRQLAAGDAVEYAVISVDGAWTGTATLPAMNTGYTSTVQVPSTVIVPLNQHVSLYGILLMSRLGGSLSAPLAFTVESSTDGGSTWTLRKTVDVSANAVTYPLVWLHANSENYWQRPDVHDVQFDTPLTGTTHLRIQASKVSYGAWPDLTSANQFSQPTSNKLSIERLIAVADGVNSHAYIQQILADGALAVWPQSESTAGATATEITGTFPASNYVNPTGVTFGQSAPIGMPDFTATRYNSAIGGALQGVWAFPTYLKATFADFFSFEIWFKLASLPGSNGFLLATGFRRIILNGGSLYAAMTPGSPIVSCSQTMTVDGLWHHAVWTKNGSTNKFILHGVDRSVAGTNVVYGGAVDGSGIGVCGDWSGTGLHVNATCCMAAMYTSPLTVAQALNHYTIATTTPPPPTLPPSGEVRIRTLTR